MILIDSNELLVNIGQYTIIDLRSKAEYDTAHIEGAVSLPVADALLKTEDGGFPAADEWAVIMGGLGICDDTKIVAYDDGVSGRAVARFWYVAKHYGHREVRILNGGFGAAAGLAISHSVTEIMPAVYTPKATSGYLLELDGVLKNLDDAALLDVRSTEEYLGGELRGNPRGGHIRGAKLVTMDNFFADAPHQSFASPEKLAQTMDNLGIHKQDLIVAY
ncbi:MAG: rhodanese-like domain-containing protein [Defluviitaleaceae bacterium]|nr:rhodanese-like domain-containing protein [Defluviitaleaceae bacterium]